jgi:quercetin dioxygenase-like cupin family protein
MFCFHTDLETRNLGNGVLMQSLGIGTHVSVLHWNMADGSKVEWHSHPHEQFGYVIAGGFDMRIGDERATLVAGDCYFIPPGVPHEFTAVGDTEAIDVFSPARAWLPGDPKDDRA